MKVTTQRLPESQVLLEIEIDPQQMERSMDKAYRKLVQRVEVPGFRKGKTPRAMLERHIGRERLLQEAIDIVVPEAYNQALEEQDIDAIDQPEIEMTGAEPLSFKATVPVRPTVELGDYKALRVPRDPVEVDPKEVEDSVDELRRRYAIHEPVEREVKPGDITRASVKIVVDDREVFNDEDAELHLREGRTIMLPGFAEAITGAKKDEAREVDLKIPEDEGGQLAGRTVHVSVTVREIKEEHLPDLDDEFARGVGEGFETMAALRERLHNDIKERSESEAAVKYQNEVVAALTENAARIEFPPVMIDREVGRLIRDQARQMGQEVARYLELIKRTPAEIREDMGPAATERVRRSLALGELADAEAIEVGEEDIQAEIDTIVAQAGGGAEEQTERYRRLFDSEEARASLGRSLLTKRTMDRLVEIVSQEDGTRPKAKTKKAAAPRAAAKKKTAAKAAESTEEES